MMKPPAINLHSLASKHQEPCISMYMPTGARNGDPSQGKIRLKNMLRESQDRIREMGVRNGKVSERVDLAYGFLEDATFWMQGGRGLAMFISPDNFEYHMLPREVNELLVVSDRFHLKPLLPLISGSMNFHILRPSQKNPKLYYATAFDLVEVTNAELPANMEDALMEEYPEKLNVRNVQPPVVGPGKLFHGHSGKMESEKEKYVRYSRIIDNKLRDRLMREKTPLMLMAVRWERDLYRQACTYPHLMEAGIEADFDGVGLSEIHERAVEAARPHYERQQKVALDKYPEKKAAGLASNDIEEIISAAVNGRVDYLFVGLGVQCWGTYDARNNKAHLHDREYTGDFDLLDFAASKTYLTGGCVYAVRVEEIPESSSKCPIAAAFRY